MRAAARPRKPSRKTLRARADRLFSLWIRERDGACRVCGSTEHLQCAHLISRRYHSVRWDPENAVALCRGHHVHFTHRPLEWEAWIESAFGGAFYTNLRRRAIQRWDGDYDTVFERIKGPAR